MACGSRADARGEDAQRAIGSLKERVLWSPDWFVCSARPRPGVRACAVLLTSTARPARGGRDSATKAPTRPRQRPEIDFLKRGIGWSAELTVLPQPQVDRRAATNPVVAPRGGVAGARPEKRAASVELGQPRRVRLAPSDSLQRNGGEYLRCQGFLAGITIGLGRLGWRCEAG